MSGVLDLSVFGTEDGNPKNIKNVDFIAVTSPSPLLEDGIIIVDTPGVGGLYKEHRDITYRYAPNADAIFFITDSLESPIGKEEILFLKDLANITSLIFFVQTKSDAASSIEARKVLMKRNCDILKNQVGIAEDKLRYFIVSAELKQEADKSNSMEDLGESGFVPVITFLKQELKDKKDRNIAQVALDRAESKLRELEMEFNSQQKIHHADSDQKRKAFQEELDVAEKALAEWNLQKRPSIEREFGDNLSALRTDALSSLTLRLKPQGEIAEKIQAQINKHNTVKEVFAYADGQKQGLAASASEALVMELRRCTQEAESLLRATALKFQLQIATQLGALNTVHADPSAIARLSIAEIMKHPEMESGFRDFRTTAIGFSAGAGVAAAIGAVVGSVIPVVGTIFGSTLGIIVAGLFGAGAASDFQEQQDCVVARREAMDAVNRQLSNAMTLVQGEFQKAFIGIQSAGMQYLRETVDKTTQAIAQQRKLLQERARQNQEQLLQAHLNLQRNEEGLKRAKVRVDALKRQFDRCP